MRTRKLDRRSDKREAAAKRPAPTASARVRRAAAALALVAMTAVVYIPVYGAGFTWDDKDYVINNPTLRSAEGLAHIWYDPGATVQYYPLTFTTFWLEYQLWRLDPTGYHVTNVLLQGVNAVLLWWVLCRLAIPGAWLAAALFAIHPVQVESVAWVTERKNVLSGAFYLAAALAYLRYAHIPGAGPSVRRPAGWYVLALVLFACALLSKTAGCTLPAALLLVAWWKRNRIAWRDAVPLWPFLALSLAMGVVTAWVERVHVGAVGQEWSLSWLERCLVAGRAVWFYFGKIFWPDPIIFIYPRWPVDAAVWWQYLYPLGVLAALFALWLTRRFIGTGPLVAALYFVGTLVPALGFINIYYMQYSFVADHFQYFACMGIIALAAAAGTWAARRFGPGIRRTAPAAAACILLVLGTLTWRQQSAYTDLESLWVDTLRKNPTAWLAHNNLGHVLSNRGDPRNALKCFNEALKYNPRYAGAYYNRGNSYGKMGDALRAIEDYTRAIELKPDYSEAYNNRGTAYDRIGESAKAIEDYSRAIQFKPDNAEAYYNRGYAHVKAGDLKRAVEDYSRAIEVSPELAPAYDARANAYYALREFDKAWADVNMCRQLGGTPNPGLLENLARVSGGSE